MDDLATFELLSLVSKITSELQNHLGITDRTLAEFVIAQHEKCSSIAEFRQSLDAIGAEFPQSLIESIDRLILTMHPKHKNKENGHKEQNGESKNLDEKNNKARLFNGLAMQDKEQTWDDDDLTTETSKPEDDTFAQLEGLAASSTQPLRKRKHEGHYDDEKDRGRSNYHRLETHSGGHYGEKRRRSLPHSSVRQPPIPEIDILPQL